MPKAVPSVLPAVRQSACQLEFLLALVGNAKAFAQVPWRPEMERHRGRDMAFQRTEYGVSWTIGMERGLER
jgi:hypothetical protein